LIILRRAQAPDQKTITAIVHAAHINPTNLNWRRFILAVDGNEIVGVGQIKNYKDGSRELASIAVIPAYQHQGIASKIIKALMKDEKGSVHLFCRAGLADFYRRFGFEVIPFQDLPPELAKINGLAEWVIVILSRLIPKIFAITAMRYVPKNTQSQGGNISQ
jgi:N-acetylglutamate synthase-like GNAT family acetyltransferase